MLPLNLDRWNKVWLSKAWSYRPVPGTSMIELHGVKGFLTPGDVAFLFNLAAELPSGGCYLEVGSWLGLSSITFANGLIANLNFQASIFCVDTWRGSPEHQSMPETRENLYAHFLQNISDAQVKSFIHAFRGDSAEVARQWIGPGLDILFIDGDHSYEGCYRDICNWRSKLNPRGRLLGHDAVPGSEVAKAVSRFCTETACTATIHPFPATHYIWEIHLNTAERYSGTRKVAPAHQQVLRGE